jgi:pimeloyl-ACP methyl ester carboxylesterase
MRYARKILLTIAFTAAITIGALVTFLAIERSRPLTLPMPTGRFAVGRLIADWRDTTHADSLAPQLGTPRELLVWIWYPAAANLRSRTEPYAPASLTSHAGVDHTPAILRLVTRDPSKVREYSVPSAPVATDEHAYPVLVMRGGASAPVVNYSTLAEDLASHGFVVVGFDAPYRTSRVVFPDGRAFARLPSNNPELAFGSADSARLMNRLLDAWTSDIAFALDRLSRLNAADSSGRFTGRLDLSRVGVFGHSLGGVEAAQYCVVDVRCKAAVDVDGAPIGRIVHDTIRRPFMFLLSDHSRENDPESRRVLMEIRLLYDRAPVDRRRSVFIRGANHFTFSDDGALLKSGFVRLVLRLAGQLHIDGRRQLEATSYCLRTFFQTYLQSPSPRTPCATVPSYPELQELEWDSTPTPR